MLATRNFRHFRAFCTNGFDVTQKLDEAFERPNSKSIVVPSEVDDGDKSILLFPGQGAQFVGMAKKLLESDEGLAIKGMFTRASNILDVDLLDICLNGPKKTLDKTLHCQPAVVVTSLAAVERLYKEKPEAIEKCIATAGFSVGEITALIFSGALSFDDGIRLVKVRAEAMQFCSDGAKSGMMTLFCGGKKKSKPALACDAAREWVADKFGFDPICQLATDLYTGVKVVSAHNECLDFIEENAADFGIRRTKRLPVSGAFHTPLMRPAVRVLQETLDTMDVNKPRIPVYSNVDRRIFRNDTLIRRLLPKQIVKSVRWEQSMHQMVAYKHEEFMPQIYECGPGKGLSAILYKINGKAGRRCTAVPV